MKTKTFIFVLLLFALTMMVEAAPQLDTFIRNNASRSHHPRMNDHPDSSHRAAHRHMSSTVMTTTGSLKGIRRTILGKDVHVFYGVPFAKPPVGPLRFKKVKNSS